MLFTSVVELLVGLRKVIAPFSLVSPLLASPFKLQLELYFLKCTHSMQYKKRCNNSKDSLGTILC